MCAIDGREVYSADRMGKQTTGLNAQHYILHMEHFLVGK